MKWITLIIFGILFLTPLKAYSQVSVNVSTLDPVYRDIDKLVANGLVYKIIMGQRPFSRKELARITAEALRNLPRLEEKLQDTKLSENEKNKIQERLEYLHPILERLKRDYNEELVQVGAIEGVKETYSIHTIENMTFDLQATNSTPRLLNNDNGLGAIDAVINPIVQNQQGRHLIQGTNLSLETSHWMRVGRYFATYVQPRFQLSMPANDNPNDNNVYLLNLYGKVNIHNVELEVGRDNIFWGQGLNSGLLLSNNPRGFDMAKLSSDSPFILPWVFKYLGAHKLSFFYADLGPEQYYSNGYLTGWKWSWLPASFFELGLALTVDSGGKGSPYSSLGERVFTSTLGFAPEGHGEDTSDKIAGVDIRLKIPSTRGTELYGEVMYEDCCHNKHYFSRAQLVADAGYIAGLYVPRVTNSGNVDLRLEYHQTGARFYRHGDFRSGWTLNQFIIGDNLGPQGKGLYIFSNIDFSQNNLLKLEAAFESRSNDLWAVDDVTILTFKKVADLPEEWRYRGGATWLHRFDPFPLLFNLKFVYENVQNFNFTAGDTKNNFLGQMTFQFDFDRWTKFQK